MKKPLFLLLACLACVSGYAQTANTDSLSLKPAARSFATELNFNPFNGNLSLNNSLNQIKFRLFTRPEFAWRFGFNVSTDGSLVDNNQPYGPNAYRYKDDKSSTTISLSVGAEKHLPGTRRLSPYVGFDLQWSNKSMKQEVIEGQTRIEIEGAWFQTVYNNNGSSSTTMTDNGYGRIGAAILTGFDFYMAKNFFVGYELSFGYEHTRYKKVEYNAFYPGNQPNNGNTNNMNDADMKNTKTTFGPRLMNGIRLGYVLK